ncbi:uncharacterized protein LOC110846101 isoform X2 [Folsomia candida]|uniref:uncharacterized protein LOC110846101 isoform X2 n=1 Tax=Folsomia candida TaxID=158441 RepID=UPI000B8F2875|nr:uncharacterized protein LOC110846101 isoform X2 [Folsomia candida]
MIGAMKRKASLSLSESCSSQSPQSLNCHDTYHPSSNSSGGSGCGLDNMENKKPYLTVLGGGSGPIMSTSASAHGPKPEKRIRWDGPRTQSLIEHYRMNEYLWNPKLADYKNDKKRTQCLELWLEVNHLEKELVNEVKMKLHGLRTSFGHQLKLESSNTSDMEKDDAGGFQSKWQWYNQLSFLKETMVFRSSSSNNNHSPSDSPPPSGMDLHHAHHGGHHDESESIKMELNAPLNMQVLSYSHPSHHSQPHEIPEYLVQQAHHHSQPQPHNLSVSAVPVPMQAHDQTHPSLLAHSRKDEDDPLSYHHGRITATPPMAHMNLSSSHSQPPSVVHQQSEITRYQSASSCCPCACNERPRSAVGEKLGRLVEETFNNLHPEYQEIAKIEIQQVLGKYLQKPVP